MQELDLIKVTLIDGPADGEKMMTPSSNTVIKYYRNDEEHFYFRFEDELKFYWGEDDG